VAIMPNLYSIMFFLLELDFLVGLLFASLE
jgi:hypothetical protein